MLSLFSGDFGFFLWVVFVVVVVYLCFICVCVVLFVCLIDFLMGVLLFCFCFVVVWV